MKDLTPVIINDDRLTPNMKRIRSGSVMLFHKPSNRSLQAKDADIVMPAPRKELYAELIDGAWYWVNGCPECNGQEPQWAYLKCDEHNVCITCKTPRNQLTETPWGRREGFQCKPCAEAEQRSKKREALDRVATKEYDEWNYHNTDEVTCPHCGTVGEGEYYEVSDGNETCNLCGGEYSLEVEHSITYTTTVIGERVTAEHD